MSKTIKIGGRIESAEQGGVVTGANAIIDDTKGKKQNVINSETDAELARLDNAKQDVLTFDNAPTENSANPVKSGGVYAADAVLQQAIEAILQLIPSAATALNQLTDKAFVNSTVATNTATFRGTYNVVTDLSLHYNSTHQEIATALLSVVQTADNNDYCFVQIPVSDSSGDIRVTERYKFNGTAWSYEYDLNNSGFTADQWAAINSTITLALVQKLAALPTAAELAQQLALKQNTLTFDTAPVAGSSNPVTSGGLYNIIAAINATIPSGASVDNKLVAESRLTQYVAAIVNALDATFNVTSTDGHVNVQLTQVDGAITSVEVITNDIASASALNTLAGRVTTNEGDIAQLQALYNALQQSAPVIIQPTDTWPVASPSATVIYRVIDRVNTPPQYYSDYMFSANDLTTPVLMAQYNNAIDDVPTAGSNNLVKSGGVFSPYISTKITIPSAQVGKYATASGNPPNKLIVSSVSNSKLIDITDIETSLYGFKYFYLKTTRVDSTYRAVVSFYCGNAAISGISATDGDNYEGVVEIPDGTTEICLNYNKDADIEFIPLYFDEVMSLKEKISSAREIVTLTTQSGYATGSGNPAHVIISAQPDSQYAVVDCSDNPNLTYYITTRPYDSSFNAVCEFANDGGIILSNVTSDLFFVNRLKLTVPQGATKLYINGRVETDIVLEIENIKIVSDVEKLKARVENELPTVKGVSTTIDPSILGSFAGISAIRFYGELPYIASKLTEFGYDNAANKFYIGINGMRGVKDYTARPTGDYAVNKRTISFILDPPSNDAKFYYVEVDIDWIAYNAASAQYIDLSSYNIYLDGLYLTQLDSIKGEIDLYSDKIIPVNSTLRGQWCNIKVHSVSSTLLLQYSGNIENITFTDVTANAIIREEYSAEEIAEKPSRSDQLKPIISETDLSNEQSSTFNGDNSYGFIRLSPTITNSHVTGCSFNNFNRIVIIDSTTRHKDTYHNVISNNMFNSCRTSMYCYSEFTRISCNYFYGCIFGIVINCSNFNAVNCNMIRCDCGIYFTSNQNSHGEISTFELAHNNVAGVYAKVITNQCGFIFTNCQFAQAMIIAEVAYALKFTSCRMDSYVRIDSGAKNSVIGCICGMNYVTSEGYSELFNVPADTLLALNRAYLSTDNDANYNN